MIQRVIAAIVAVALLAGGAQAAQVVSSFVAPLPLALGGTGSATGTIAADITANSFTASKLNYSYPGSKWDSEFHANWNVVQTQVPNNPTEWQVYPNGLQGLATAVMGTGQIVNDPANSNPFTAALVGKLFYFNDPNYGEGYFTVDSFTDANHITLKNTDGSAVSFPDSSKWTWQYVTTSIDNICSVNGTLATLVSGQPFIPFSTTMLVNGTSYTYTFNSSTSVTLGTNLGIMPSATCHTEVNIFDEASLVRLQKIVGANEEDFAISARANGEYALFSSYAGLGQYHPVVLYTGENPSGTLQALLSANPSASGVGHPGSISLGGKPGYDAFRVESNPAEVNFIDVTGGPTTVGPSIRARGTDTNVGLGIDTLGSGAIIFTSHSFTNAEFQVFAGGGSSWLAVASDSGGEPTLSANGAASNIAIKFAPKGSGIVQATGPIVSSGYVQTQPTVVASLATCSAGLTGARDFVTDATATTFLSAVTGGGSNEVPVVCDGTSWKIG